MGVPEEFEMDDGVRVTVKPVPPRLYAALVARYERGRPRPRPPVVEVKYKGEEPEEQENPHDPEYEARVEAWRRGLEAHLFGWFMDHAVEIEVPDSWDGGLLPEAGVRVPGVPLWLARLPLLDRLAQARRRRRGRLYYDYYATRGDVRKMSQAMLSAAGVYSEEMLGEAEDSFPGDRGRGTTEEIRDEGQRGARKLDLHRTAGDGSARLQPGGVDEPERLGQGEAGSLPAVQSQNRGGRGRARGKEGEGEGETITLAD